MHLFLTEKIKTIFFYLFHVVLPIAGIILIFINLLFNIFDKPKPPEFTPGYKIEILNFSSGDGLFYPLDIDYSESNKVLYVSFSDGCDLYSGPGFGKILFLPRYTEVIVLGKSKDCYLVNTESRKGWVFDGYLSQNISDKNLMEKSKRETIR